MKDENGKYSLIRFEHFDLFKRAKWEKEPDVISGGAALADMCVQPVKGTANYTNPTFATGGH